MDSSVSRTRASRPNAGNSATYREALDACSRVAEEEFEIAAEALRQAEALSKQLRASVGSIAEQRGSDGVAVDAARQRLRELQAKLDATLLTSLAETKQALEKKHTALHRFTVTLFGRTMAGKSTIREALTGGDGATIGKGGQRTTRDVREYDWNLLRVIDTPGIGAYDGEEDRRHALSVLDETDIVLFLLSTDGIQEEVFKGMQTLRQQNKPVIFVLNVKRDLLKPVFMRRFLADPGATFVPEEIGGHLARVHQLAGEFLGMRNIRVIPVHAQAAYLSTRPEHEAVSSLLAEHSRFGLLLAEIENEVRRRGCIRRVQTIIDGTSVSLLDLQEELHQHVKGIRQAATLLKTKFAELDSWFDRFTARAKAQVKKEAAILLQPLRMDISAFIDENIERNDVDERWKKRVDALGIQAWMERQQTVLLDELRARLTEFSREIAVESKLTMELGASGPKSFDPFDVKRTLKWVSAGSAAVGSVAAVALMFGAGNIWNPVGLVATAVGLVAFALSWFFDDREKTLQRQKAKAAAQLRKTINKLEQDLVRALQAWIDEQVVGRSIKTFRTETIQLYEGMYGIARSLDDGSRKLGRVVEDLDRRLLVRTGQFLGFAVSPNQLVRVVRDPGMGAKFISARFHQVSRFCREVGEAITEQVDGVEDGPADAVAAGALRPAVVSRSMISITGRSALARLPKPEIGRAIGKAGSNVRLASRLVGLHIKIVPEAV